MNLTIFVEDALPILAFMMAIAFALAIPTWEDSPVAASTKAFLVAAMATYLALSTISVLDTIPLVKTYLAPLENSVELLFSPLLLAAAYSLYARQRLNDEKSAERAVTQTSEMMGSIVETTPAGVLVLDVSGWMTFANEAARSMLDLDEEPDTGVLRTPGWSVHVGDQSAADQPTRGDLGALVGEEPRQGTHLVVEWPDGARRRFIANMAPVRGADGVVTGAIVAFLESEPWRALGHQG